MYFKNKRKTMFKTILEEKNLSYLKQCAAVIMVLGPTNVPPQLTSPSFISAAYHGYL